jgi:hypothetical protein
VDIDGDGHLDIISGCYSRMEGKMAGLFYVMYGNADGTFRAPEVLKGADGEPLIIPIKGDEQMTENICTRPFAVDLDGDGKLDLVVGNFAGTFYWFKGVGKGAFNPKPEMLMAGKEPLRIPGAHSDPFVIDWNGDGALDIVSGAHGGGVYWAENIAGKGKPPVFKQFKELIPPAKYSDEVKSLSESDLKGPTQMTRVWVADFNGDGKLDIIVGDCVTLVSPAKGVNEEEMKKKLAEWNKELQAAYSAQAKPGEKVDEKEQEKLQEKIGRLYEGRSKFMTEERTGYVWVYLRK